VQRITPRYVFEARVRITVQRDSQAMVVDGWARDMSEGGMSAFVAHSLSLGEELTLEIPVGTARWLRIPAKVAGCRGTQYGFQFTALSPDQRTQILSAVNRQPEVIDETHAGGQRATTPEADSSAASAAWEEGRRRTVAAAFAERARTLIKRGYTPKVAVELVLQDIQLEHGSNAKIMEEARADAHSFLLNIRRELL